VQTDQTKRDGGITPPEKGKKGKVGGGDLSPREYFINISEKCNLWIIIYPKFRGMGTSHQVAKATSEGDKCQV
jgi:hypothetical protein